MADCQVAAEDAAAAGKLRSRWAHCDIAHLHLPTRSLQCNHPRPVAAAGPASGRGEGSCARPCSQSGSQFLRPVWSQTPSVHLQKQCTPALLIIRMAVGIQHGLGALRRHALQTWTAPRGNGTRNGKQSTTTWPPRGGEETSRRCVRQGRVQMRAAPALCEAAPMKTRPSSFCFTASSTVRLRGSSGRGSGVSHSVESRLMPLYMSLTISNSKPSGRSSTSSPARRAAVPMVAWPAARSTVLDKRRSNRALHQSHALWAGLQGCATAVAAEGCQERLRRRAQLAKTHAAGTRCQKLSEMHSAGTRCQKLSETHTARISRMGGVDLRSVAVARGAAVGLPLLVRVDARAALLDAHDGAPEVPVILLDPRLQGVAAR